MHRRLTTILAVVAALLLVAGTAVAQETDARPDAGRLWAFGDGSADLDVERGAVALWTIGDVTITGPAGLDVRIDSWTGGADQPLTRDGDVEITLTGFVGSIGVRGEGYQVTVDGLVALKGIGGGTATFDGEGLWRTLRNRGTWPEVVTLVEE